MPRRPTGLFLLGLAGSAHAAPSPEQALGELQLQLEPRHVLFDESSTDPYYRFAFFAQVTGGGHSGGDVGVGAAAAVSGLGCDFAAATMHGRFRPFADDQHGSAEATYSICLSKVLLTTYFEGRRAEAIAPAMDARRSLWSRRYVTIHDRMGIGFGEVWSPGSRSRHTIFSMALGHGTTTQADGLETRTIKQLDLDFAMYRYRHLGGLSFDALVFTNEAMKSGTDDRGGVATAFIPVRVRYETPAYYIAAQAGWGMTGGAVTASGSTEVDGEVVSSWTETIDSEGLPQITRLIGAVEAGMRRDRMTANANLGRAFYPTFDGNIARESRLSGVVTYTPGKTRRTRLALAPFVTRTRTWTRDAGSARELAAGASLQLGRELSKQLRVDAIGEAGISPYMRLDGERLPSSALGGQVVVALSGRVAQ
jgi:hypothetical protein